MTYRDFTPGIRFAITWLHKRANEMNDPKAKQILDAAAFSLGVEHAHRQKPKDGTVAVPSGGV
jgi:hypothetical protein